MSSNASEGFSWGNSLAHAEGLAATGAPADTCHDRGGADDHWVRAAGEECTRCEAAIVEGDFVRRRADGTWVHQECRAVAARDEADD
jgi:hypothetical protein